MKIRDLWQRVGESRSGPRRRGSVLTNRPEVNVLDRPSNRLSVKAEIPLRPALKEKKNFRPSRDTPSCFVSKVCMRFASTAEAFRDVKVIPF